MTTTDFSNQFDVLWNNISSNQAPGLNEYEKSIFLTKAQRLLVREYFNNRIDAVGGGFDGSQKRQYDFSSLINVISLPQISVSNIDIGKIDKRSIVYILPSDYFLSVNEILEDSQYLYSILPIDYNEYQRLMLKPYSMPVKKGAWRLITGKKVFLAGTDDSHNYNYIIPPITGYSKVSLTICANGNADFSSVVEWPSYNGGYFYYKWNNTSCAISANDSSDIDAGGDDPDLYNIIIDFLTSASSINDQDTIEAIKYGFELYKNDSHFGNDNNLTRAYIHTDRCTGITAPASGNAYLTEEGSTVVGFTVELSTITHNSIVEIIGKFNNTPTYQMRYVKQLKPIILEDLDNYGDNSLEIDSYNTVTLCELPEECHEEVLERAVTLAKIAWQGGTMTLALATQSRLDKD